MVKKSSSKEINEKFSKTEAGVVDDLGPDRNIEEFKLERSTIILGILLLITSIVFFYLLGSKTGANFGIQQIIFAIIITLIGTAFLRWIKFYMSKNPYLGLIIGLLVLGFSLYSLRQKFQGPNTIAFSWIISIIVLIYLLIHFLKGKKINSS